MTSKAPCGQKKYSIIFTVREIPYAASGKRLGRVFGYF